MFNRCLFLLPAVILSATGCGFGGNEEVLSSTNALRDSIAAPRLLSDGRYEVTCSDGTRTWKEIHSESVLFETSGERVCVGNRLLALENRVWLMNPGDGPNCAFSKGSIIRFPGELPEPDEQGRYLITLRNNHFLQGCELKQGFVFASQVQFVPFWDDLSHNPDVPSTPTPRPVPTLTPIPTVIHTPTPMPEPTATATPAPSPEPTATATPAPSPEPTATVTPAPSPEPTATATPTL